MGRSENRVLLNTNVDWIIPPMGDLQDPTDGGTELYHIFGQIFWGYSLKFRPAKIGLIGRYLQSRILK